MWTNPSLAKSSSLLQGLFYVIFAKRGIIRSVSHSEEKYIYSDLDQKAVYESYFCVLITGYIQPICSIIYKKCPIQTF